MFKLIVIAIVVFVVVKKMPRTKALAAQKINSAPVQQVKEQGRGLIVMLLIGCIKMLSGLLSLVIGTSDKNLPVIRK